MSHLLQIDHVTKRFGGLVAVDDVTLNQEEGEILGLIGPNGAGKTTLFNMISGAYTPTTGQIRYEGVDTTGMAPHKICNLGIARTFQIAKPFANLSVVDNVQVGVFLHTDNTLKARERAYEVLETVGLEHAADQLASTLTTAGRKRLELARALSTEPRLLLLDEVMAGLTPTESLEIVELIKDIRNQGVTMLVIEHVMQAIMSLSDRVAVLHHGELIAIDKPAEIASDAHVIEAYLGKEFEIADD